MFAVRNFFLMMMMMMMKSGAAEVITARSGERVRLTPKSLKGAWPKMMSDIRWTHQHLVLSLQNNRTTCHHRRCTMWRNGTLEFTHVQRADAGNYSLEVFDAAGTRLMREDFLLTVEWAGLSHGGSSALVTIFIFIIIIGSYVFIRRRRSQTTLRTGSPQENVYMMMHGNCGNKKVDKQDEKKEREEEDPYVLCQTRSPVSMETPITVQRAVEEEDIYV